ncbi:sucrose nonfermenting 4-like protein isoform X3 [Diospyros lotus]|uniref:sucrose nonfermenting 4-like protein isoform X3 n=1 Tax=Diospyros lotus TaxID=55363 RepID=UPI00224E167C|nr:sucrose nonfermenting 4-like protein isoform X3 [Diospyros lotus]
MFGFPADTGRDNALGSVLIPTRFVWPYGGRRVFLCGSFTGWSEHIPMSPMEGCPTVFQVIYSLSLGYHEYKFFVDGEWRHDEHQRFVSGNCGVVNTVFLAREPDMIPAIYSPGTPGRSNMDVDNDPFLRSEAVPRISEVDIEISRHRISVFLSMHTAYDLLPESGKVIVLDVNLPVKQAFHILYEQGIPVAPLWDCYKCQFVGVLSALDFILILRESGPHDSLKDVTLKILQNKVATVPIIHSFSQDGSFPQLLHLASLSGILKCICRYFKHSSSSLPILQQPICSLPLGTWVPKIGESNGRPFAMLRSNASLNAALSLLVQAEVSSIPIVDDDDSLLDIYCRSDITALAKDRAYAQVCLEELSIHQALQLGQDSSSPYGFVSGQRCQMCLRSDPLHKVMERLANPGVRRLVIVEAGSKRVEGIVSLSDVFRFLLS